MLNTVLDLRHLVKEETNPNLVCFEQSQVEPKVVYLVTLGASYFCFARATYIIESTKLCVFV